MEENVKNLRTPVEVQQELEGNAFLTADQATYIASEVYQPLYLAIQGLNFEINVLRRSIKTPLDTNTEK